VNDASGTVGSGDVDEALQFPFTNNKVRNSRNLPTKKNDSLLRITSNGASLSVQGEL
jgi:hypothetical protein